MRIKRPLTHRPRRITSLPEGRPIRPSRRPSVMDTTPRSVSVSTGRALPPPLPPSAAPRHPPTTALLLPADHRPLPPPHLHVLVFMYYTLSPLHPLCPATRGRRHRPPHAHPLPRQHDAAAAAAARGVLTTRARLQEGERAPGEGAPVIPAHSGAPCGMGGRVWPPWRTEVEARVCPSIEHPPVFPPPFANEIGRPSPHAPARPAVPTAPATDGAMLPSVHTIAKSTDSRHAAMRGAGTSTERPRLYGKKRKTLRAIMHVCTVAAERDTPSSPSPERKNEERRAPAVACLQSRNIAPSTTAAAAAAPTRLPTSLIGQRGQGTAIRGTRPLSTAAGRRAGAGWREASGRQAPRSGARVGASR